VGPGESGDSTGIWAISILGGAPRKLRDDAGRASVSPDDSQIAYIAGRSESEIWVMGRGGENPRKLLQGPPGNRFLQVQWSPDGKRIATLRSYTERDESQTIIETAPLTGGTSGTILSAPGLRSFCWCSDGRIVYSKEEPPPNDRDTNLWELQVESSGVKSSGSPRPITSWAGLSLSDLSVSRDSKHLAFVNAGLQTDIYVAALEGNSGLGSPQRFTLVGRNNTPSAWTPDGRALFFDSDRNGNRTIFRQSLQGRNAQDFFWGPGEQTEPRLSPDASWVLYWDHVGKGDWASEPMRLLRVPISGGAPELVVQAGPGAAVRCGHRDSMCILGELDRANGELVFTALDPRQGRKGELVRLATDLAASPSWDLSPDGSTVAIVNLDDHRNSIRLVVLDTGSSHSIAVGPSEHLSGITWSADGSGWFATSSSLLGARIFLVTLNGTVSELWTTRSSLRTPLASPDGKNLAFTISTYNSNAWVIKSF